MSENEHTSRGRASSASRSGSESDEGRGRGNGSYIILDLEIFKDGREVTGKKNEEHILFPNTILSGELL